MPHGNIFGQVRRRVAFPPANAVIAALRARRDPGADGWNRVRISMRLGRYGLRHNL